MFWANLTAFALQAQALAAALIASMVEASGADPAAVQVVGFSTDCDMEPGCCDHTLPGCCAPTTQIGTSHQIKITPEFLASLAAPEDLLDCYLSLDEIMNNPGAEALYLGLIASMIESTGANPGDVQISGISTDCDDDNTGCNGPCAGNQGLLGTQHAIEMDTEFVKTLGTPAQLADCYLSMNELMQDPEGYLLVQTMIAAQAATLGIPAEDISISGFSTDCDEVRSRADQKT